MALSSSYSSAIVAVDKATSDLLIAPDWTMNMDICDAVNTNRWQAKDVVKAVKRRLLHKSSRVQLLSLTLLETMVKNCGDHVHFLIAERSILGEMVKIVKKKADMQVRDKILVLLDSWQEAFGGPGGKHPQYYWAYDELRRSGVDFPRRESDSALIFTTPNNTYPTPRHAQAGFGMPSNSPRRLDEAMATEVESLSLTSLASMRNVMELLNDMLQAVNPSDRAAVKDEVIVDLVERCRSNQKKLMTMLTTTGDEELLGHGLELNDALQGLLAKHDAIAMGLPLPSQAKSPSAVSSQPTITSASTITEEARDSSPNVSANPVIPVTNVTKSHTNEEEEEEDDFAQLARRHSKARSVPSQTTSAGITDSLAIVSIGDVTVSSAPASTLSPCTALVLPDPPAPVKTKEQEIIDLLSITLSTSTLPHAPEAPTVSSQGTHQAPVSSTAQGHPSDPQTVYPGNQVQAPYNSYVVPWAQPEPIVKSHGQFHQPQPQVQSQPRYYQPQPQVQSQPQYSQYPYPPPPWAGTFNQEPIHTSSMFYTPRPSQTASYTPMQVPGPLHHHNSFPLRTSYGLAMQGDARMTSGPGNPAPAACQKPFVPSYRLFEDLNVLGNRDGKLDMANRTTPSMAGTTVGQSMVGGRK